MCVGMFKALIECDNEVTGILGQGTGRVVHGCMAAQIGAPDVVIEPLRSGWPPDSAGVCGDSSP